MRTPVQATARPAGPGRDDSLDRAKGIAIILVIAGHTFQGMRPDFDNFFPFRFVYSFHMPLFMFLSGAVAALKPFDPMRPAAQAVKGALTAVQRAALRLLLPYAAWTVVMFYWDKRYLSMSLSGWLITVLHKPDYSLWFLPVLFECLVCWQGCLALAALLGAGAKRLQGGRFAGHGDRVPALLGLALIAARLIWNDHIPDSLGLDATKVYFPYFLAGACYRLYAWEALRGAWRLLPYVLFLGLVPFWYRLVPGPLADGLATYVGKGPAEAGYRFVVALSGTLAVIDIARALGTLGAGLFNRALAYCGKMSLGIYAFQFHFLGVPPPVLMPLVLSLAASWAVQKTPGLRLALLGERS